MLCRALQGAIMLQAISYIWRADGISFGAVNGDLLGSFAVLDPFSDRLLKPVKRVFARLVVPLEQASVKTLRFGTVGALSPLP